MTHLRSITAKLTFTLAVFASGVLALLAITSPVAAWGPERPTYTNNSPADWATFNSITDNAGVGDERNFVRIGEAGSTDPYTDHIEIVPGHEYEVYIYYHNDAADDTNYTGYGIAADTRVFSSYPATVRRGQEETVYGSISWNYIDTTNTDHDAIVWDEAYLTTQADNVVLRFKPASIVLHNMTATNGSILSTNLFREPGTLIGFKELNGIIPGCAQYSGYITYTLVAESTSSTLTKQVSLDGENWSDEVTVAPGQYATYKVNFTNTGNTILNNVIFKDAHDSKMLLRFGSTKVFDADHPNGLAIDDIIDISGYNVGSVYPGTSVAIIYQAQVDPTYNVCSRFKNTVSVAYNSEAQQTDDASVVVACKDNETPIEVNPTPPEEETPTEIVNTGPLEVTMAIVIVLAIVGIGFYFWRTKHVLREVENKAKGK